MIRNQIQKEQQQNKFEDTETMEGNQNNRLVQKQWEENKTN